MKRNFFISLFACLLVVMPIMAIAGQVNLQWDPNTSTPPDGYLLYQRDNDASQSYNYNSPVVVSGITNANGDIPATITQLIVDKLGIVGKDITYYFVVRAYLDKAGGRDVSGDSNEINIQFDYRVPTEATGLTATYDDSSGQITVVWQQASPELVDNWKVYTADVSGGPYTILDTVRNTGQTSPTTTKAISVPSGQKKTIYFVVVSFRSDTLYSKNSGEVSVIVDNRVVTPPVLQVVTVTIPVTN